MDIDFLVKIYNTLMLVQTNGESTVLMGDCLKALKKWIENYSDTEEKEG